MLYARAPALLDAVIGSTPEGTLTLKDPAALPAVPALLRALYEGFDTVFETTPLWLTSEVLRLALQYRIEDAVQSCVSRLGSALSMALQTSEQGSRAKGVEEVGDVALVAHILMTTVMYPRRAFQGLQRECLTWVVNVPDQVDSPPCAMQAMASVECDLMMLGRTIAQCLPGRLRRRKERAWVY